MVNIKSEIEQKFNDLAFNEPFVKSLGTALDNTKAALAYLQKYPVLGNQILSFMALSTKENHKDIAEKILSLPNVFETAALNYKFLKEFRENISKYPSIFLSDSNGIQTLISARLPISELGLGLSSKIVSHLPPAFRGTDHIIDSIEKEIEKGMNKTNPDWCGKDLMSFLEILDKDEVFSFIRRYDVLYALNMDVIFESYENAAYERKEYGHRFIGLLESMSFEQKMVIFDKSGFFDHYRNKVMHDYHEHLKLEITPPNHFELN